MVARCYKSAFTYLCHLESFILTLRQHQELQCWSDITQFLEESVYRIAGNFRKFRIVEHHTKIKILAQYVLRNYAELYEYLNYEKNGVVHTKICTTKFTRYMVPIYRSHTFVSAHCTVMLQSCLLTLQPVWHHPPIETLSQFSQHRRATLNVTDKSCTITCTST